MGDGSVLPAASLALISSQMFGNKYVYPALMRSSVCDHSRWTEVLSWGQVHDAQQSLATHVDAHVAAVHCRIRHLDASHGISTTITSEPTDRVGVDIKSYCIPTNAGRPPPPPQSAAATAHSRHIREPQHTGEADNNPPSSLLQQSSRGHVPADSCP